MDDYQHHKPKARASTRRAYEYAWRRYTEWCATEGREPWHDPLGETYAAFVAAMTRSGLKATTLRQCRAAMVYRYRTDPALHGLADPTRTKAVRDEMTTINEQDSNRRPPKALEMTPDMMEKVLTASVLRRSGEGHKQAALRHAEAEATLRLMYDAALRVDDMARVEWGDLDPKPDDGGYRTLYVRPGKTRRDRYAPVGPQTWEAVQHWGDLSGRTGRISTANSAQALGQRIRRLGEFAGILITGHSPRRGRATTAARDGATEYELMALGGWKSPEVVAEYVKPLHANRVVARLYPNGHDDPGPEPATVAGQVTVANAAKLQYTDIGMLAMAVIFDLLPPDKRAESVATVRNRILEWWPHRDPPRECARDGCAGFVLTVNPRPDERWCSDQCRQTARNTRRRAARKANKI